MRKRHGPARDRQLKAVELHLAGHTYRDIAQRVGYRSEAGARMAVNRDFARRSAGVDERREKHSARLEKLIAAHWSRATSGRDAVAAGTVLKAMADLAKLWGLDAAQRHLVVDVSEADFAERAAELLAAVGDGPLRELAGLPPAPAEPVVAPGTDGWVSESWSNLPGPHSDDDAVPGVPALPGSESSESDGSATVFTDDEDTEPVEVEVVEAEIVAEVIPLPPAQRRVPASEVLTADGVPLARSGIARRIGGYDPTYHWRP